MITAILLILVAIFVAAVVVAAYTIIHNIYRNRESLADRWAYEDALKSDPENFASDIQDAIREDDATVGGTQERLWETGQMPVAGKAFLTEPAPQPKAATVLPLAAMPAAAMETAATDTPPLTGPSPESGKPATAGATTTATATGGTTTPANWWDTVAPETIHAAAALAALDSSVVELASVTDEPGSVPLPETSMEQPEAVSVAPGAVQEPSEDTSTWSARMLGKHELWLAQQEAERARWRGEMGLSDEPLAA